ncbi:hypothetical protein C1X64_03650 [Pseudomonas sp. GW456-E7]|nr:hypothetical protein C1X64_03650 [Pseudomonas sp. GW456-E7]
MGASLLAMAPFQATTMPAVKMSSRASSLPQVLCDFPVIRRPEKNINSSDCKTCPATRSGIVNSPLSRPFRSQRRRC